MPQKFGAVGYVGICVVLLLEMSQLSYIIICTAVSSIITYSFITGRMNHYTYVAEISTGSQKNVHQL